MKNRPTTPAKKVHATAHATTPAESIASRFSPLTYVFVFLSLVPIYIYVSTINMYAVNFPYLDDYDAILRFLNEFTDADVGNKMALLFRPHGEHRILHSRIIYVLYHYLFGEINFVSLIWIGNLQYIGMFAIMVYFMKKSLPDMWYAGALILSISMFDLSNSENANFAMAGISNYGIILLFFLTLYCFSRPSKVAFGIGAALLFFTVFSNGNGTIAGILLVAYLALSKQKERAIISGVILIACVAGYFLRLDKAPPSGDDTTNPLKMAKYLVYLSGGHFGFDYVYTYNFRIGLACIVFFATVLLYRPLVIFRRELLPLTIVCAFLAGSMLSIAIFRSDVKDFYHLSHSGRYLVYPHILVPLIFFFLMVKLDKMQKLRWVALFIFIVLLTVTFKYNSATAINGLSVQNKRLRFNNVFYEWNRPGAVARATEIEQESCRKGIYCLSSER